MEVRQSAYSERGEDILVRGDRPEDEDETKMRRKRDEDEDANEEEKRRTTT